MKPYNLVFISFCLLTVLCISALSEDETADEWYKKGRDLAWNGSYEEAVCAYQNAIEIEPNNSTFYTAIVSSLNTLALATNDKHRRNESLKAIDKALELDPKNPVAWEQKGSILYYQDHKYNESLDAYDKAIDNISSYRQDYPQSTTLNSSGFLSYIWTSKSIVLWQLERYNDSSDALETAVWIDPENYDAWMLKGELLASTGRYNESLHAFDVATTIGKASNTSELETLPSIKEGYVLMCMGRYDQADLLYRNIIDLNLTGDDANRQLSVAWLGLGHALIKMGKYNDSLQAFEMSIELDEVVAPYAWTGKGDALKAFGKYDGALEAYDQALENFQNYEYSGIAHTEKGKGDVLTRLGKHDDALDAYKKSVNASDMAIFAFNNSTPLEKAISFTYDPYSLDQRFWIDRGSALRALGLEDYALNSYERALDFSNATLLQNPLEFEPYNDKGKILFELGRYDESLQTYDRFINTNPGPNASSKALVWKGKLLFEMGRSSESLKNLNLAVNLDPQSVEAWRWKAGISAEMGLYEEALEAYNETIRFGGLEDYTDVELERTGVLNALDRQSDFEEYIKDGRALERVGRWEDALEAYEKAIELNRSNASAWTARGRVLSMLSLQATGVRQNETMKDALLSANEAIELDPQDSRSWSGKGFVLSQMAMVTSNQSLYNESLQAHEKAIEVARDNETLAEAWFEKGYTLNRMKSSVEAIVAHEKAIELNRSYAAAWVGKATALFRLEMYEEAVLAYDKVFEIYTDDEQRLFDYPYLWYSKARALEKLGRPDEASKAYNNSIEDANKIIAKVSSGEEFYMNLTVAWQWKSQLLEGLDRYEEAVDALDNASGYWTEKGYDLSLNGSNEEALLAYEKAIELDHENYVAWINKANVLYRLNKTSESDQAYRRALEIMDKMLNADPGNTTLWLGKGVLLNNIGEIEAAVDAFDNASKIDPQNEMAWKMKGVLLASDLHRYDDAIVAYEAALKIDPTDGEVWNLKGDALKALGRQDEAEAAYAKAEEYGYQKTNR